ncbi:MAG: GEVED domain-containing protein [Cyanobacteria bacterium P01_D01_bin.156]
MKWSRQQLNHDNAGIKLLTNSLRLGLGAMTSAASLWLAYGAVSSQSANAGPLTSITTTTPPATNSFIYTAGGQEHRFGQGNDVILQSVTDASGTYSPDTVADQVIVRRVDNANVSGEKCGIFAAQSGSNVRHYGPTYPHFSPQDANGNCSYEAILSGFNIGLGALDLFSNTPSGGDNEYNNVERIDFIFNDGIHAPFNSSLLNQAGHIVTEKSANNAYMIAAVTAVDGAGNPTAYATPVWVAGYEDTYTPAGLTVVRMAQVGSATQNGFLTSDSNSAPHGAPSRKGGQAEKFGGAFVTLQDMGLAAGQKYYGFSFIPADVESAIGTSSADLLDYTSFPTTTSRHASGYEPGDGDMFGGTAGYFIAYSSNNISGSLYEDDSPQNNSFDSGSESKLGNNIEVILYGDVNGNNTYDAGSDTIIDTTDTTNGDYSFTNIPEGTYGIYVNTADGDIASNLSLGTPNNLSVTLNGSDITNQNFGFDSTVVGGICANPISGPFNSSNYALNTPLQGSLPLSFYGGGMLFDANLSGIATWKDGVQIRNDSTVGQQIFLQPENASDYLNTNNEAIYTFTFPNPVTDLTLQGAGLNNEDGTTILPSYQGVPIPTTSANFSGLNPVPGMRLEDADGNGESDTVVGSSTAGGVSVTTNIYTFTIPGPVDTLTIVSGKDDVNRNSTVTIGLHSFGFCGDGVLDYGDAPDSYGTNATDDGGEGIGPSHAIVSGIHLGTAPDAESDAETPLDGSGDGAEDNGITLPTLTEGDTSYSIPAANINATGSGTLHAWIDFNKSGTFEPGEHKSVEVISGTPSGALIWSGITAGAAGDTYARFRFTSDTSITLNTPGGAAGDGEVEDYQVAISTSVLPTFSCSTNANLFNTGYSGSGKAATGTRDLNWDVGYISAATGSPDIVAAPSSITNWVDAYVTGRVTTAWDPSVFGQAEWISHVNDTDHTGQKVDVFYRYQFNIDPAVTLDSFAVHMDWMADNSIWEIYVNGTPQSGNLGDIPQDPTSPYFHLGFKQANRAQTVLTENWQPGTNELIVRVRSEQPLQGFVGEISADVLCIPDFGDAPDTYGTDATDDSGEGIGPNHIIVGGIHLGTIAPDAEANAETPLDGTGDGAEDDGVTMPASIQPGETISLPITVTGSGNLTAWIDWNGDGTFAAGEQIATDAVDGGTGDTDGNIDGTITLSVTAPAGATVIGNTYARFRYSSDTGLGATGAASDGEVEDYPLTISLQDIPKIPDLPPITPPTPEIPDSICALPGSDGTAALSGVLNTYYPGVSSASAGATTLSLGPIHTGGNTTTIEKGDKLLIIQMQDADITSTNADTYGSGTSGTAASGSTALNTAGYYQYVVADSAVGAAGGTLQLADPLAFTFTHSDFSGTSGQRRFQVIRMPQYYDASITGIVTAAPWNGASGGVVGLDVAKTLTFAGGTIDVSGQGFRGGGGLNVLGDGVALPYPGNTDYVSLATNPYHGSKGEGIAGTPRYIRNDVTTTVTDTGIEGYPNGSFGRGAPGNAGGGSTDPKSSANAANTGGGGGANGGYGGHGGDSWIDTHGRQPMGGFGGQAFPSSSSRVIMGGGGGAGTANNSAGGVTPSGGGGGGIVILRAGEIAGSGTIEANGIQGVEPTGTDGGGGGGAGGSVVMLSVDPSSATVTINARGGRGLDSGFREHGPGGGGGGGYVAYDGITPTVDIAGGEPGNDQASASTSAGADPAADPYGATAGGSGLAQSTTIPDQGVEPGGECLEPQVLLVKRITAINGAVSTNNGDDLAAYMDETSNPYDDNTLTTPVPTPPDTDQWPNPNMSLVGGIHGGNVAFDDEIEYTIYFLSSGNTTAENVLFCDYVPEFTSFLPNAYAGNSANPDGIGIDLSVELFRNGTTDYHTGANDGDSATYFAPGVDPAATFPGIDCEGDEDNDPLTPTTNTNNNGALVVNLGDLPDATSDSTGAYGYVRFRTRVK